MLVGDMSTLSKLEREFDHHFHGNHRRLKPIVVVGSRFSDDIKTFPQSFQRESDSQQLL